MSELRLRWPQSIGYIHATRTNSGLSFPTMGDVTKKAGGYVQVKLIPSDRSGQTWSGWARRWVDLLLVKKDSMKTKKETYIEAWIEVRKKKSSARPIKMWTIDAKGELRINKQKRSSLLELS